MKSKLRAALPQGLVNLLYHLPWAVVANLYYGFPSRGLSVIGVTGTDGKTTTVNMIYQILKGEGKKVSMVSSIKAVIGGKTHPMGLHITSPGSFEIQNLIKKSQKAGDEYLVLEVTSHALDQYRFWGINFEVGVVTNVTHEHLDYHKSFDHYLRTKSKLPAGAKWAVLNKDDPNFHILSRLAKGRVVSFGLKNAQINLITHPLKLKLLGRYNLSNALAASAVGEILGIDKKKIIRSLKNFDSLEGRMQEIKNNKGVGVIVDFAHTPNALSQALSTLRQKTKGRLIAVFGCAGGRDHSKRSIMGKISSKLADVTVLTDEDPRFEDSEVIINQIASGAISGSRIIKQPNRAKAIKLAIGLARKGDIIGIFGKGHERSMSYRGVERPWSDLKVARRLLKDG